MLQLAIETNLKRKRARHFSAVNPSKFAPLHCISKAISLILPLNRIKQGPQLYLE